MSTALLTDRYELTMLESALQSGLAGRRAVFEVFARRLPPGRRYGIVAGQGRLRTLLDDFTYGPDELAALDFLDDGTRHWLDGRELGGDISTYAEGETYVPGSPVLTVESCFGEGLLLETLVLSVLNFDSAVASAAARMVVAAKGRPLIEMGSRRTSEQAAVAAARAAYVAGFATTSNLEAGRRHGIPTAGTSAHAFVLAAGDEVAAFTAQVKAQGPGTALLVDTYDTEQGIRNAVAVAGPELGAVRLDSGDLADETRRARRLLDQLGATGTRIVVTGDLDELSIAALEATPADAYGVGTSVVTGSGAPSAGFVYKLVAIADSDDPDAPMRPVAKRSTGKATVGGRKWAARIDGGEVLRLSPDGFPAEARMLQGPLGEDDVQTARERCAASLAELPEDARRLGRGEPCWTAEVED
ncbi:MAG: nicotinate phosphoribosyltransferase [Frankiales bacterium]|jgi:nicotinate phosphoribosyltransferase|nr:nicotinate phosphoribosyltransferase [Frankiales bacterium]